MFDHIGLRVASLAVSMAFYRQTLAPLGLELVSSGDDYAGFGPRGAPRLWLTRWRASRDAAFMAFSANSAEAVNAFTPQVWPLVP